MRLRSRAISVVPRLPLQSERSRCSAWAADLGGQEGVTRFPVVSIRYHAVMGMTLRTSEQQTEALRQQATAEERSMQAVALSAIDEYIARRTHKAKVAAALQRVVHEEAGVLERLKDA